LCGAISGAKIATTIQATAIDGAGDRERLAPRADPRRRRRRGEPERRARHVIRILGSITP
jgi:hypothetical protein